MFVNPSALIVRRPSSIARGERSQPTNLASGSETAIGMRLEPSLQPTSSTLQQSTRGAGCPTKVATDASRAGCVAGCGSASYGISS